MQLLVLSLLLIITKIQCGCISGFYETVCDNISDVKNGKGRDIVSLTVGNLKKSPTETLSASTFKNYPNLEELTVVSSANKIEVDAFRELSKLLMLKLHKNSFQVLPDFAFIVLPHLTKLDLQDNNIEQITTYGPFLYQNLKTVNLSFNKLRDLNWQCFASPGLERLIITNNKIQDIGKRGVLSPDLILLNLDSNELYHLEDDTFQDVEKLEELILSRNKFSTVWTKFKSKSLNKLDFSHNRITVIAEGAFDGLPFLQHLYLNHNLIKKLPQYIAKMNIITLHLHNNRLQHLDKVTENPSFQYELTFGKNPLPCPCLDNLLLFMTLRNISTTECEDVYFRSGKYPTCIAIDSKWDNGKCTHHDVIEDYIYTFLDMNNNLTDCELSNV